MSSKTQLALSLDGLSTMTLSHWGQAVIAIPPYQKIVDPDLVVFKLSKMKVMVASKICEPAHTLKKEPEFDSNVMETKPKTSNKRRKITYYTVSILGFAALGITAGLLVYATRNFT